MRPALLDEIQEQYAPEDETAEGLNVTPRTLRRWRTEGSGPPFVKIGNHVFYPRNLLRDWLQQQVKIPPRSMKRRAAA